MGAYYWLLLSQWLLKISVDPTVIDIAGSFASADTSPLSTVSWQQPVLTTGKLALWYLAESLLYATSYIYIYIACIKVMLFQ
jgi:hypothetical protein